MAITGGCPIFTKYFLFILAFISMPFGLAMISIFTTMVRAGELVQFDKYFKQALTIEITLFILIGLGVTFFFEGLTLFLGNLYENKPSFQLVFIICVFAIVGQLSTGAYISSQYNDAVNVIDTNVAAMMGRYSDNNNSTERILIDYCQQKYRCCGWQNVSDWLSVPWYQAKSIMVTPKSCCDNMTSDAIYQQCQASKAYYIIPCKEAINAYMVGVVTNVVVLVIPEFFMIVISLAMGGYLYSNMGRVEYKYS